MRMLAKWFVCMVACCGTSFAGLTMYMGAAGSNFFGVVTTNGANAGAVTVINTSFPVNGLAAGPGFFFAGDPTSQTLRRVGLTGTLNSSVTGNFPGGCCGESMYYDGTVLWHVHYGSAGEIEKLDPTTGNVIQAYPQSNKVGITPVNGTFWITTWNTGDVGPWDPATNMFTPAFNTGANSFPAGLAYDPAANILWVGNGNTNSVVPYTLTGTKLNAGFVPFTSGNNEIDGLTVYSSNGAPGTPAPPSLMLVMLALAALGVFFGVNGVLRRRREA